MVNDAKAHGEEDKKRREEVEVKNQADTLVYTSEKTLKEYGDKIGEDEKQKVQTAVDDLKKKMEGGNVDEIKASMDALTQASHKIAEVIYQEAAKQQQAQAAAQGPGPDSSTETSQDAGKDENIGDADFEVVDDDK